MGNVNTAKRMLLVAAMALLVPLVTLTAKAQEPTTSPTSPPTTPSTEATTPTPTSTEAPSSNPAPEPLPGSVRYGGTLGVVSLPRVLSLEGLVRWKQWGFGAQVEYLPPDLVKFGDATTLSWFQVDAQARYFVWKPIFVGALAGYQFSRADSTKFGSKVNYISTAMVVGLRAGVLFTLKNGLAMGGDFGVTVPLFTSLELNSDGTEDSNARKAARTFGESAMPYLSLFRIGFFY